MAEWMNTGVGWVANLIQIGTFLFTIVVLWRTRQRLKRLIVGAQSASAGRPVALAVDLPENTGSVQLRTEAGKWVDLGNFGALEVEDR